MPWLTVDRAFAVLGLVLALPGLAIFLTVGVVAGAIMLVLGAMLLISWGVMAYLGSLPAFTVLNHDIELSFWAGRRYCRLQKRYTFRANHRHQRIVTFRNNSADGRISQIRWNGEKVKPAWVKQEAGDLRISIPLESSPRLFETFSGVLQIHASDSFDGNPEFLIYQPDFKTKRANIKVNLPREAPCRSAKFYVFTASEKEMAEPTISNGNRTIEYRLRRPRIGNEYKLLWWW